MASDNIRRSSITYDEETGEEDQIVICLKSTRLTCNDWRNEPREEQHFPTNFHSRNSFRVPASSTVSLSVKVPRESHINGVNLSILNTQNLTSIALLIPTLFLFPAWAAILGAFGETSFHIWAHKRNKRKAEDPVKSPFNVITSQFCAECRTDQWMQKIGEIQDKRSLRRNLIDPSVIKQVVR